MKHILVSLMVCLYAIPSFAAQCRQYESRIETLTGVLQNETFAGPPNYKDIKAGDKPETFLVLHLEKPICVVATSSDELNTSELNVKSIQLVLSARQLKLLQTQVGARVSLSGMLFHKRNAHHHTRVLMGY